MRQQRLVDVAPARGRRVEEFRCACTGVGQDGLQTQCQHAKQIQALRAYGLQLGVGTFLFGDHPGLFFINVTIGVICKSSDQSNREAEFARDFYDVLFENKRRGWVKKDLLEVI